MKKRWYYLGFGVLLIVGAIVLSYQFFGGFYKECANIALDKIFTFTQKSTVDGVHAHNGTNSLVTELVNVEVQGNTTIYFERPVEGWLYIESDSPVVLDTKPISLAAGETMRFVSAGRHSVLVSAGHLTIRAIPEIAFYDFHSPTASGVVRTWEDIKKYDIWNNYNVMVSEGDIDRYADYVAQWRAKGGKWIRNAYVKNASRGRGPDQWHEMMIDPRSDGIIVDEFMTRMIDSFPAWAQIIRDIKADPAAEGKMFYGFLSNHAKPELDIIVRAILDCGYKIAPEGYLMEYETEERENRVLHNWAGGVPRNWIRLFGPASINQMLFTLCPVDVGKNATRWNRFDSVDFKVHLDKTFYEIVNSPEFTDLGGVSFWRAHYVSEETMGHFNALIRHYLIEGNTKRLYDDPYILVAKDENQNE